MDENKGLQKGANQIKSQANSFAFTNIVLDKSIFSNIFEKDIRRVYIYKKAERIAKALHLIAPAFKDSKAIRDRFNALSVELIDGAVRPIAESREDLSRSLLALGSLLSLVRDSGVLSSMNADIIGNEVRHLLHDVASYESQKIAFDEIPTLAQLSKETGSRGTNVRKTSISKDAPDMSFKKQDKGHASAVSDIPHKSGRRETILSILRSKGPSYIKDLSTLIRDVSEKTIQRELQVLVQEGVVKKTGERRWTTYTIAEKTDVPSPIDFVPFSG